MMRAGFITRCCISDEVAVKTHHLTLRVDKMPEVLAMIRREMSAGLREAASACITREAREEIERVALALELGMRREDV